MISRNIFPRQLIKYLMEKIILLLNHVELATLLQVTTVTTLVWLFHSLKWEKAQNGCLNAKPYQNWTVWDGKSTIVWWWLLTHARDFVPDWNSKAVCYFHITWKPTKGCLGRTLFWRVWPSMKNIWFYIFLNSLVP